MKRYDIQLVAEDVKRSFLRSGKRHILITGKKGAGKTTLARFLAGEAFAGFSSRAVPHSRVLLRDNLTGEECVIGQYSSEMGRMVPVYEGFSQLGVKILKLSLAYEGAVLLDEIGYLESDADDFKYAVEMVLAKKDTILTVRRENTEFILKLKSRSDVFVVDLDILYGGVGCVIMASGYSKRFGSNKLLEDFCGAKLIEHAIFATDGMFGKRIVVTRYDEVAELCRKHGVQYVLHNLPDRSDTVRLGIEQMDGMDGCMFLPSDQPLLKRETVMALAESFLGESHKIWRVLADGEVGMPVIFPQQAFGELKALTSGGGASVIKKHPELLRLLEIENKEELFDADTPEKLLELSCLWKR